MQGTLRVAMALDVTNMNDDMMEQNIISQRGDKTNIHTNQSG